MLVLWLEDAWVIEHEPEALCQYRVGVGSRVQLDPEHSVIDTRDREQAGLPEGLPEHRVEVVPRDVVMRLELRKQFGVIPRILQAERGPAGQDLLEELVIG